MKRNQYARFGDIIRELRRRNQETKGELADMLEVSEDYVSEMERGTSQPSEDILELLASHFGLDEAASDNLWKLAGYDESQPDSAIQTIMLPITEARINYTDMVHVTVNNFGVVVNFMQTSGPQNQPMVVSRLGMSKEHALSVIDTIAKTIRASIEQDVSVENTVKQLPGKSTE